MGVYRRIQALWRKRKNDWKKKTKREKRTDSKKMDEEVKLIRKHRRNLMSQWAKEQLRDKTHLDASEFEKDRMKFVSHARAVKFFGPTFSKKVLAYGKFSSSELTEEQSLELEGSSKWHSPKHIFRVASGLRSLQPPYYQATNGLDSKDVHVPASLCEKYVGDHTIAHSLPNETQIIEKLGHRLLWHDRNADPFLSWTPSMLFVLVLGTARLARKQSFINISSVDTEQAQTARPLKEDIKVSREGPKRPIKLNFDDGSFERRGQAIFYSAEALLRETNARCWDGWGAGDVTNLTSDWFTGEWLSHGIVLSELGSSQGRLADLLDAGLYDLHQQLLTEDGEDMKSLYHRCVRARSLAFSIHDEGQSVTMEELQGNSDLAALFMSPEERKEKKHDPNSLKPPLHIFLSFLGLKKRIRKDHLFMQWIRDHYTADDIAACGYEKTIKIANNLPEVMETIHLARDAAIALDTTPVAEIPVWLADPDFDFHGQWRHEFPKEIKVKQSWRRYLRVKDFDKDGMAVSVVHLKKGWDVRVDWNCYRPKQFRTREVDEEYPDFGDGDDDEDGSEVEVEDTDETMGFEIPAAQILKDIRDKAEVLVDEEEFTDDGELSADEEEFSGDTASENNDPSRKQERAEADKVNEDEMVQV